MAVIKPYLINASAGVPAYSGEDLRRVMGGLITKNGGVIPARSGVLQWLGLYPSLSGTTVSVTAGECVIGTSKGAYVTGADAAETVGTLAASDATNPRIDRVILEVRDPDNGGAAGRDAVLRIVTGTPAATPSAPAIPALSVLLGTVNVPAGTGTPTMTDSRDFTSAAGAPYWVRNQAHRDTVTAYEGMTVRRWDWNGWTETFFNANGWDGPKDVSMLTVTDWSSTGVARVSPDGSKRRVTLNFNVQRTGADTTIAQSWSTVGTFLPPEIRTAATTVLYFPMLVTGGTAVAIGGMSINTATGVMTIRGVGANLVVSTNSVWTVNAVYSL